MTSVKEPGHSATRVSPYEEEISSHEKSGGKPSQKLRQPSKAPFCTFVFSGLVVLRVERLVIVLSRELTHPNRERKHKTDRKESNQSPGFGNKAKDWGQRCLGKCPVVLLTSASCSKFQNA